MKLKAILALLLVGILMLVNLGRYIIHSRKIDVIYVSHSGFGETTPEYKIDLKNKQFWKYTATGRGAEYVRRNPAAPNEGFQFVRDLEDSKIKTFRRQAICYGPAYWNNRYERPNIADGHHWGMQIYFASGSQKKIFGSNRYPIFWNYMYDAFEQLTGESVLLYKRNWLNH